MPWVVLSVIRHWDQCVLHGGVETHWPGGGRWGADVHQHRVGSIRGRWHAWWLHHWLWPWNRCSVSKCWEAAVSVLWIVDKKKSWALLYIHWSSQNHWITGQVNWEVSVNCDIQYLFRSGLLFEEATVHERMDLNAHDRFNLVTAFNFRLFAPNEYAHDLYIWHVEWRMITNCLAIATLQ